MTRINYEVVDVTICIFKVPEYERCCVDILARHHQHRRPVNEPRYLCEYLTGERYFDHDTVEEYSAHQMSLRDPL